MTPYYSENLITLYCGDAREVLPALLTRVAWVDACVTDPPYGDTSLEWAGMVPGWLDGVQPFTNNVWCFGSFRMFMEMARRGESSDWTLAQEIVWEKQNGSGFHNDRFKRVHELAVQWYQGKWEDIYKAPVTTPDATARTVRRKQRPPHMGDIGTGAYASEDGGPRLMRSVIYAANCHGYADHPTQKPIEILDPLLRYSVPPGGSVIDPFCGAGSTLVAAKRLGMRAIGIEIDEKYCAAAVQRLRQDVLPLEAA